MIQTLFDFDLKRASREHYVTQIAAIIYRTPKGFAAGGSG